MPDETTITFPRQVGGHTVGDYRDGYIVLLDGSTFLVNVDLGTQTEEEIDAAFLAAIEAGPQLPPEPVPAEVSASQLKEWCLLNGYDVPAVIGAMHGPEKVAAQSRWDNNTVFRRDSDLLVSLATALGMGSEDLDQAFREASQIDAR